MSAMLARKEIERILLDESISEVEESDAIIGVRVGVGGEEAKEFVNDIFQMYHNLFHFMHHVLALLPSRK